MIEARKILLTGAGGFLGRYLVRRLVEDGFRVVAVSSRDEDMLSESCGVRFDGIEATAVRQDDWEGIKASLLSCDVVLSCGFPRGGGGSEMAHGLRFISALFMAAADADVGAIVNVSSQSVYDQHRTAPARETDPVCPQGDYAVAKYATELMLEAVCRDVPHTSIRLASLIGPGFNQRVTNRMVKRALSGEQLSIEDNGSKFGYLDVEDAVLGISALVKADVREWETTMNLGPTEGVTLTDIANAVINAVAGYGMLPLKPIVKATALKPTDSRLDSELFSTVTGWVPSISLMESVEHIASFEHEVERC